MSVHPTKLHALHTQLATVMAEMLRGEPLVCDGVVIMHEGKPLIMPPKPSVLKEVREFLKDNGIDEAKIYNSPTENLALGLKHFEDDDLEPQMIEAADK